MRSSSSRSVAGLAVLCCAVSACGSGTSASTPSVAVSSVAAPSPVVSAPSSSASRTPTASPSGSYDPALVAEAEKVFREYQDGLSVAESQGGATALPATLLAITASPIREQTTALLLQQSHEGWRMEGSKPPVSVYGPERVPSDRKGLIAIHGCVDARNDRVVRSDGTTNQHGKAVEYMSYFSRVGRDLKISDTDTRNVAKC